MPLRVSRSPATPEHLAAAHQLLAHHPSLPINPAGAFLLGSALIAAAFKFIGTAGAGAATVGGVTGLALLAYGGLGLWSYAMSLSYHRSFAHALAPVLKDNTVTIIELDAADLIWAEPVDDDANALVLTDGHGHALYINSHRLFEIAPSDQGAPTHWRITASGSEGIILALETDGDRIRAREGPGSLPFEPENLRNAFCYEVVVLPHGEVPSAWARALSPTIHA